MSEEAYVEYTGNRVGSFSVWGRATGRGYRVSRRLPVIVVAVEDVPSVLTHADFKVLSVPKAAPTSARVLRDRPQAAADVARQVTEMFPGRIMRPRDERGTTKA